MLFKKNVYKTWKYKILEKRKIYIYIWLLHAYTYLGVMFSCIQAF